MNGRTSEGYLDMIREVTGCSIGKGNLLLFHRPITYPLKVLIFRKDTKDSVVITYDGKKAVKINLNIDGDKATKPDVWQHIQEKIRSVSDTFSMVTIANAWAEGRPL